MQGPNQFDRERVDEWLSRQGHLLSLPYINRPSLTTWWSIIRNYLASPACDQPDLVFLRERASYLRRADQPPDFTKSFLEEGHQVWNGFKKLRSSLSLHNIHIPNPVLESLNLRDLDLTEFDFSGVSLRNTDIRGSNLTSTVWGGVPKQLEGANVELADLRGARNLNCHDLRLANGWQASFRDHSLRCGCVLSPPQINQSAGILNFFGKKPVNTKLSDDSQQLKVKSAMETWDFRVVVIADLTGAGVRFIEISESLGPPGGEVFQAQIRNFLDTAQKTARARDDEGVYERTGDGAKLAFSDSGRAHDFAIALHDAAELHTNPVQAPSAERHFRVGIAATDNPTREHHDSIATRAARLEQKAEPEGILIDVTTWSKLHSLKQNLYQGIEVEGKEGEYSIKAFKLK